MTSKGLRSTRATARHRVVSDGGTSNVSEPESLRKTHLTWGEVPLGNGLRGATLATVYPDGGGDALGFREFGNQGEDYDPRNPRCSAGRVSTGGVRGAAGWVSG